ncbi:urea ABC transporter permease subunit UrtB [Oricola cellulosilytica]|uniref:Urea ABC transporter permease subunit UrtB n=1 Tax=Oricola cellulosilytica TaxID=1429082 RepID=A0A4R0PEP5_9HYPH|nr:urea ABC transporter permease subunit UrtB [Oricola cellulosilytica]TCD16276.1 urea ABC transporter permease subunit UrtB [Oricola cellulosilytica]
MRRIASFIACLVFLVLSGLSARAQDDEALRGAVAGFATAEGFQQIGAVIDALVVLGDPRATRVLAALGEGDLKVREADGGVFIVRGSAASVRLIDPVNGDTAGEAGGASLKKIRVNNRLRRTVRDAIGALTLTAADPAVRMRAAETLFANPDPDALEAVEAALERETNADVRRGMEVARAASLLLSDRSNAEKSEAVGAVAALGTREALGLLSQFRTGATGALELQAAAAMERIEGSLARWSIAQNFWYGLSLGSVLLLAAIGLAITFGVMGVINMAHGEMVMIGAYTTFAVQEVIRRSAPGLLDWSLPIALPLAFLAAALVGMLIERGVIRFLYGRPLETLLATWGVSLILQQAVRSIFGPSNREVSNPSWMSGAFELGQMMITWNRLYILLFAMAVFAVLLWAMNRTMLGLQMRAVTQNRRMASAMGIRAPWIDAMTFALGSGVAGIAGVALSQIDNVSPNLGQSYIIDSFLVVVFGGVGNLWGTLVGAMSLGVVNKLLEPYAGAVLGKILILVLIIFFIQKRPRGLFALRGRAVEA